ncbi:MAG: hypothetical protein IPM34_04640 [Saprospiraceae bacterium]|nr:hypothetical protein [Saprospiraceae bacterium]
MLTRKLIYWILAASYFGLGIFIWYTEFVQTPWHIVFAVACFIVGILRFRKAFHANDLD